jgi:hypothetical protein
MTLEDEIQYVSDLDSLRKEAFNLLDRAQAILEPLGSSHVQEWQNSGNAVEAALLIRAQKRYRTDKDIVDHLIAIGLDDLFEENSKEKPEGVPVLTAARVMQALVATSEHAFSRTTLLCYYRIVREIYTARPPDWSTGGARAGGGGRSTAFMTGECIRAISAFENSIRNTAAYFTKTYQLYKAHKKLSSLGSLDSWRAFEGERLALAWYTMTDVRLGAIALNLSPKDPVGHLDSEYIDRYLDGLGSELLSNLGSARDNFRAALTDVDAYRQRERARFTEASPRYIMQESAHRMGRSVVEKAVARAEDAIALCEGNRNTVLENLAVLSKLFNDTAAAVHKILEPARGFVGTILDRELTAASAKSTLQLDVPELIFAAASYGATTNWHEERIGRACELLADKISEKGEFPLGRPFHSTDLGFRMNPIGFEIARACAQLFGHADFPLDTRLPKRLLQLFIRHAVPMELAGASGIAWSFDAAPAPNKPSVWATAVAVLALRQYIKMLDKVINRIVLPYFDVSWPFVGGGLKLGNLMYPDFGLSLAPKNLVAGHRCAILLETLRAHLLRTRLPKAYGGACFSTLFYGPPGTGKTTLLEALARSSGVPLVKISPSDIAVGGQEAVERRARAIFTALSMLTKVAILFDEFEPVLLNRELGGEQIEQRNFMTFLTPAMLPKLTMLHERAERQMVVYSLITNHYGKLDPAAIRKGRFDNHIEILHPDPLSRVGFLLGCIVDEALGGLSEKEWGRVEEVIKKTAGFSVQFLAGTLFRSHALHDYILGKVEFFDFASFVRDENPAKKSNANPLENWLWNWEDDLKETSLRKTVLDREGSGKRA